MGASSHGHDRPTERPAGSNAPRAEPSGVDLSLIDATSAWSVEERLRQNDRTLEMARQLRQALRDAR